MTCSDVSNQVGETRTIEGCTIKFKNFLESYPNIYASIDITYPWGITHSISILHGETKTIVNPSNANEYVTINFKSYVIDVLAMFNVCYEQEAVAGSIFCESNPSGAKVYYKNTYGDNYTYMGTTDILIEGVPSGIRYIKMTLSGYHDHEDSYLVNPGEITGVDIDLEPIVTKCTQQFRLEDQDGNPLAGSITGEEISPIITVPASGEVSTQLIEDKIYTVTAFVGALEVTKTFTACTGKITFQFTIVEQCTQQFRLEDQNGNSVSGTLSIAGKDFDVTGDISLFLEKGKEYAATAIVGDETKQKAFTACTGKITFQFTTAIKCQAYDSVTNAELQAVIYIDGTKISFLTPFSTEVTPGNHTVKFACEGMGSCEGYESKEVTVTVNPGETVNAHGSMIKIDDYTSTSLTISIDPTNIGPGQYSDITGHLTIQGQQQIVPGIPLKLYCDKGTGYQVISTPTTPPSGTGTVIYHYGAQQDDAGKTLKFKYVYEGSETLKLNPSESGIAELTVSEEPILIETITTLAVSPSEIKPGNILILKAKITEKETGNTLPIGTFVHFYIGEKNLGISGTIADGYAYTQFKIPVNYIGPYICKSKYDGIVNKYSASESTFNINVNPECVEHETEPACEAADCHWWTDDTCKGYAEPPPEATGSIGFIIRPHSWYAGNTEQAVVDLTAKTSEIISAMTKYFTSFVDIEFVSIDIYHDKNIDRVILKIYYKESGIQTMVVPPPVALAGMAIGAIAALFVVITIVGWIESWFADDESDNPTVVPEDEIIDAGQGGIDAAGDDAAGNVYDIDDDTATALNDCLAVAETEEDIIECYGLAAIPDEDNTNDNAETFGIAKWTAALAVLYTLCASLQDQIYCDKADELGSTLNVVLTEFSAGTITKEQFLLTITQELNAIDNFLQQKEEEAKEEREEYATDHCFIVNPGYPLTSNNPCIITNTQAAVGGAVIGLGILGFFLLRR